MPTKERPKKREKILSYNGQVRRNMIRRERANGASANEARRLVTPKIAEMEARRLAIAPASELDF
jgi:hypothetical protein